MRECNQSSIFNIVFFQLVISVMADQFANGLEAERLGFGLHIPFLELSEEKLLESLKTILGQPAFANKAKTLGSALVDQVSAILT